MQYAFQSCQIRLIYHQFAYSTNILKVLFRMPILHTSLSEYSQAGVAGAKHVYTHFRDFLRKVDWMGKYMGLQMLWIVPELRGPGSGMIAEK
jgi:hypothetical protein